MMPPRKRFILALTLAASVAAPTVASAAVAVTDTQGQHKIVKPKRPPNG